MGGGNVTKNNNLAMPSLLCLPFLALAYVTSRHRQDEDWSYRQALANSALKAGLKNYTALRTRWRLSLNPRREADRFTLIEPASPELYKDILADKYIQPETIGATWYPEPLLPTKGISKDKYVVLHFHGGSYVLGDGRTSSCGFIADNFLQNMATSHVLCPQHRLAYTSEGRFPAQLQDAVTAYKYLIDQMQIHPSQIVISGDSSGGHLALDLLRYIVDFNSVSVLPAPKCSLLWSPWCDVPAARNRNEWRRNKNYKTDYVPPSFPAWGATQFLKGLEITDEVEKYVAPMWHPFHLPAPVLVVTGQKEVLFEDHKRLVEDFKKYAGNGDKVELLSIANVPHDVLMIGWIMGFRKEASESTTAAGEFIQGQLGATLNQ